MKTTMPHLEFEAEKAKILDEIVVQAKANRQISPDIATKCMKMVSECMTKEEVEKLTNSVRHLVDLSAPLPIELNLNNTRTNQAAPLQHCCNWHRYVTAALWNLYKCGPDIDEKVHKTIVHMKNIGLRNPSEKTAAYAAGIIHFVEDGFSYDPTKALLTKTKLKDMLKQLWLQPPQDFGRLPQNYPPTPEMFKLDYPELYEQAFGEEGAGECPIQEQQLLAIRTNTPCRSTKATVRLDSQANNCPFKNARPMSADQLKNLYTHREGIQYRLALPMSAHTPHLDRAPSEISIQMCRAPSEAANRAHSEPASQIPSPLPSPSQSPRPMETQSCSGTAGVSAAAPMASPESQTDEGCGLPLASVEITDSKIGSEHQIGAVFADRPPPRQMINMFGNRYKDLALGAYNLPDTAMASAPSSSTTVTIMPAATYNLTEKYIAKGKRPRKSKRNPKGAIKAALKHDVRKRGPLPECPGIGNKPPIRYGKSTVFFSPAGAV